jgi:hypothetical protein
VSISHLAAFCFQFFQSRSQQELETNSTEATGIDIASWLSETHSQRCARRVLGRAAETIMI